MCIFAGIKLTPMAGLIFTTVHVMTVVSVVRSGDVEHDTQHEGEGMSIKSIARELSISRNSVRKYLRSEPKGKQNRKRVMCSLYHLDSYKREYMELSRYKGESRGGFADFLHPPHGTGDSHA